MQLLDIQNILQENSKDLTDEFKRLFHGRGGLYEGFKHLTVDSIDTILSVALYFEEESEAELIKMLQDFVQGSRYTTLIVQRRYLQGSPSEVIIGELSDSVFVVENGMKIKLNLLSNRNSGYFPDMKNGREFVRENAKNRRVLNLFSYTCAFSVAAKFGGANSVVNIDMSKSALSSGKTNHSINNLDPRGVSFLPYTCYPSVEEDIKRAGYQDAPMVVEDANIMTSRGPATAICFALAIVKKLQGKEKYEAIKAGLLAEHC